MELSHPDSLIHPVYFQDHCMIEWLHKAETIILPYQIFLIVWTLHLIHDHVYLFSFNKSSYRYVCFGGKCIPENFFYIFWCLVQWKTQVNRKCFLWSTKNKPNRVEIFFHFSRAENVFRNVTYSTNHHKCFLAYFQGQPNTGKQVCFPENIFRQNKQNYLSKHHNNYSGIANLTLNLLVH